jgi:hypothetical protein
MHHSFRIAARFVTVAFGFEVTPQIRMVVNLAITYDYDISIFASDGLPSILGIDYRQTGHSQRDWA